MKRSEMVRLIQQMFEESRGDDVGESVLAAIETAGMLPPDISCKDYVPGIRFKDRREWESEE